MKLYLASTSKFKSEILSKVHLKHICLDSDYEEISNNDNVYDYVKELALGKANSVKDKVDGGIIIGLDTIVYVNNKILGKPKDREVAREYLKLCSNNTSLVITGICIINMPTNEIICDYAETKIKLRFINEKDIEYYLNNEIDYLYASGFIIETMISNFIDKIEGSYYNILGIPCEKIYEIINNMNYYLEDFE